MGIIKGPEIKQEWQKHEPKINGDLIAVKVLMNGVSFKSVLINTGYECYSIMDKDLVTELRFPCIKIPPKLITGLIKENIKEPWVKITEIIKFFINIQGYRRNIFAYVVPTFLNLVIIRLL